MAHAGDEPPPREIRPLLRFAKLPPRGVAVIRAVLDADEAFRAQVAEDADEAELGRASWLFIARPDGWEAELEGLVDAADTAEAALGEAADEKRATRRLAKAEERIARLESNLAVAREREARAVEELAAVRRARHAAGTRAQEAEAARDAAVAEVERLRAALAAVPTAPPRPAPPAPPPPPPAPPPPPPAPEVDVAGIRAALDAAMSLLPPPPSTPSAPPPRAQARPAKPAPARRRPIPLPPGILDDSPEAADFVVRANGVVVLVDGYNATLSAWPDLPLSQQRDRLVDALAELVARTGADATVVFDGVDADAQRARRRLPVKILFSPADTPADDVILDLVDAVSAHRPVVVASDDRAVQDGASERGANVLTRAQLLQALRRTGR